MAESLLHVCPDRSAPLDPGFVPAARANARYRAAVRSADDTAVLLLALERENGQLRRSELEILAPGSRYDADTLRYVDRHIKFLLWAWGGWRLMLAGPKPVCQAMRDQYRIPDGPRAFDAGIMAAVYERPFTVETAEPDQMPEPRESASRIGGHLDGCRIGFDLGASDYKLAAVVEGKTVFSDERPWHPTAEADPDYHRSHILSGLEDAACRLPRLDAIGGSAAGIYVNNQVKRASLFRAVPEDVFQDKVKPMFLEIQKAFGVPMVVANDGDVTALAGAMSLQRHAMLGIAMGSSEAAGYLDGKGCISGILTELAFAPVDFNPDAVRDEWSGDIGVGAQYFSQQAVARLAPAAGLALPEDLPLPERLKAVQSLVNDADPRATAIFETIGVYLGYTLAHYADYYPFENVLVLGRVTSGRGGEIIRTNAGEVLEKDFPDLAERSTVHVPDEASRRVGQAVAAASLPEIGTRGTRT